MSGKLQIEEAINRLEEVRSVCLGMALSEMIEKDERNVFDLASDILSDNIPILENGFRELFNQIHTFRHKEDEQGEFEIPKQVKAFLQEKVANGIAEKPESKEQRLSKVSMLDRLNQVATDLCGASRLIEFACDAMEGQGENADWMMPIIECLERSTDSISVLKNELNAAW